MKYLAMVEMEAGQNMPSQEVETAVLESVRQRGLQMPPVREGWRKESDGLVEICSKPFPGARPVWYWEVK